MILLPIAPRPVDINAWRAHLDEKSARARRFLRLERDAAESARRKPAALPLASPEIIRPCAGCARATRPGSRGPEEFPGTVKRARAGLCGPCARRGQS